MDYPTVPICQRVQDKHVKIGQSLTYNASKDMAISQIANDCVLLRSMGPRHPIRPTHMQKKKYVYPLSTEVRPA